MMRHSVRNSSYFHMIVLPCVPANVADAPAITSDFTQYERRVHSASYTSHTPLPFTFHWIVNPSRRKKSWETVFILGSHVPR